MQTVSLWEPDSARREDAGFGPRDMAVTLACLSAPARGCPGAGSGGDISPSEAARGQASHLSLQLIRTAWLSSWALLHAGGSFKPWLFPCAPGREICSGPDTNLGCSPEEGRSEASYMAVLNCKLNPAQPF